MFVTLNFKEFLRTAFKKISDKNDRFSISKQMIKVNQESFSKMIASDDLNDAKNQLADMNRRLHELELELRRLENEREELAAAYKEAEAVSIEISSRWFMKDFKVLVINSIGYSTNWELNFDSQGRKVEEQRSQRLSAELSQLRHEVERRLAEKDEEIEAIRYVFN